jgi:endo-1,3(4)-beta-glucanase
MTNGNFLAKTAISYLTTKGYMLGMTGNVWRMSYALSTITWNAPRSPHSSCTASIIQGLEYEVAALVASTPPAAADFYWWGGSIAAKARLALIVSPISPSIEPYLTILGGPCGSHRFKKSSCNLAKGSL